MENAIARLILDYLINIGGYDSAEKANDALNNEGSVNELMPEVFREFLEINTEGKYPDEVNTLILILFVGGFNPDLQADGECGEQFTKAINAYLKSIGQPALEIEEVTEEFKEEDFKTASSSEE